jgi:hypothetical protein
VASKQILAEMPVLLTPKDDAKMPEGAIEKFPVQMLSSATRDSAAWPVETGDGPYSKGDKG